MKIFKNNFRNSINILNLKLWAPLGLAIFETTYVNQNRKIISRIKIRKDDYGILIVTGLIILTTCIIDLNKHLKIKNIAIDHAIRIATDCVYSLNAVLQIMLSAIKSKHKDDIYTNLNLIFDKCEILGIELQTVKKVNRYTALLSILIFILTLFFLITFGIFWKNLIHIRPLLLAKIIISIICFYLDLGIITIYLLDIFLMRNLYKECFIQIMKILEIKKGTKDIYECCNYISNCNCLYSHQNLHKNLVKLNVLYSKNSRVTILIWIIFGTTTTIMNLYLLLKSCIDGHLSSLKIGHIILECRIFTTSVITLSSIIFFEKWKNVVSNF